jgi:hypothetical protein
LGALRQLKSAKPAPCGTTPVALDTKALVISSKGRHAAGLKLRSEEGPHAPLVSAKARGQL